jgi:gamma-glutamylputrescine oxidase
MSGPLWLDAAPPPAPRPPRYERADLAIVGAGLAGLSTAFHVLVRSPGARVIVLEAARVGAGASGRTTGMLSPGVGQSVVALAARLGKERARATYAATLEAVRAVQKLIVTQGIDCELTMSGQLVVARSAGGRRRLQQTLAMMRELEQPVEALDDAATARRIRLQPLRGGADEKAGPAALYYPTAGTLHPVKLLGGLLERVRDRGGQLYEDARVRRIESTGDGAAVRLHLDDGPIVADQVVVATAGYTPELGLLRGRVLPVHLQALATEPLSASELDAIGWAGREGVLDARRLFGYLRLTTDNRVVLGGGLPRYRFGGATDAGNDTAALLALRHELAQTFPKEVQPRVERMWTGVIGYVVDALPTIGRDPRSPRVLHLCGWCGHGVALATAAGSWAAQLLQDGNRVDSGPDLPWFRAAPPRVPTEVARYVGFRASVWSMALLDRLDR